MIPAYPDEKTPPGEVEVFRRLKKDPETCDWIVLHSLDIADHVKRVSGEADFLIIIPNHGVLCLEIKSHDRIRRTKQGWFYGNKTEADVRGPFKQASEAMHSLRAYLTHRSSNYKNLVFWSAACFPYASFNPITCEWDEWQCIDKSKFSRAPLSRICVGILEKAQEKMNKKGHKWVNDAVAAYSREKLEPIAQIYRPCFEAISSAHSRISALESEINEYTEEQFRALDFIGGNPRVVFSGPAGTGKTFVSIEAAIRARRENPNAKVKWICYNKNLARWINKRSALKGSGIEATYIHDWLLKISDSKPTQAQFKNPNYWKSELPQLALEALLRREVTDEEKIDVLIADEAQDLLQNDLLDFLDFMLLGGLSTGTWMFFGDYTMQSIYNPTEDFDLSTLDGRCNPIPICNLNINCRNKPRIAQRAGRLGRMSPGYTSVLRADDKKEPQFRYYQNSQAQLDLLIEALDTLKEEGYRNEDIVILSPLKKKALALKLARLSKWKSSLINEASPVTGKIRYSTIHGFKGLEAPVILITDIEQVASRQDEMLLYIGLTRSTDSAFAFINSNAQQDLLKILLKKT